MSTVAEVIVDLLKKEAANYVIKMLIARLPFLGSWFFNPIIGFIVTQVIDVLYDKGALAINWMWIIVENQAELKEAIQTKENLKAVLRTNENYKEAEEKFDEAADDLIKRHIGGRLPR